MVEERHPRPEEQLFSFRNVQLFKNEILGTGSMELCIKPSVTSYSVLPKSCIQRYSKGMMILILALSIDNLSRDLN